MAGASMKLAHSFQVVRVLSQYGRFVRMRITGEALFAYIHDYVCA